MSKGRGPSAMVLEGILKGYSSFAVWLIAVFYC